jgi:hypothetical protein
MDLEHLLVNLSIATWDQLEQSRRAGFSPREETVTENLLVAMNKRAGGRVHIRKTTGSEEAKTGADFAWALQLGSGEWLNLLIQAKKLNHRTKNYSAMRDPNAWLQARSLQIEGAATNALAAYLFYNGDDLGPPGAQLLFGLCCRSPVNRAREGPPWAPMRASPAGCVLASAELVEFLITTGSATNAVNLSAAGGTPWECLLCPHSAHRRRPLGVLGRRDFDRAGDIDDEVVPWVSEGRPLWADLVMEGRTPLPSNDLSPNATYYVVTEATDT